MSESQLDWMFIAGEVLECTMQWALVNCPALQPHGDNKKHTEFQLILLLFKNVLLTIYPSFPVPGTNNSQYPAVGIVLEKK